MEYENILLGLKMMLQNETDYQFYSKRINIQRHVSLCILFRPFKRQLCTSLMCAGKKN